MGICPSAPSRKFQRANSLRTSYRKSKYLEFDMELFKIENEIRTTQGTMTKENISDIKQRLYCLRRDFDASKSREKYEAEFQPKFRRVIEALERKVNNNCKRTTNKERCVANRRKRRAPPPPPPLQQENQNPFYEISHHNTRNFHTISKKDILKTHASSQQLQNVWVKVEKLEKEVFAFRGRRNDDIYLYLHSTLVTCLQETKELDFSEFSYIERERQGCVELITRTLKLLDKNVCDNSEYYENIKLKRNSQGLMV